MRHLPLLLLALSFSAHAQDFSAGLTGVGSSAYQPQPAAPQAPLTLAKPDAATLGMYRLGAGDKVRITVFGENDLSGEFEIDGTGRLAFPLVGDIPAGNRTARDVEDTIRTKLAEGYLVNPRVNVEVLNFRPFFILGEVGKPGSYPYVNDMSVISAVALAGGYTPRAKTGHVMLKKSGTQTEVEAGEDTRIQPGDVIRVEERFF